MECHCFDTIPNQNFNKDVVFIVSYLAFTKWWFYAMASSHSSSPVPQSNSSDAFFKKEMDTTKRFRPVQSLPDVCPKEPTGNVGLKESENAVKFANAFTIVQSDFLIYCL